MDSYFAPAEKSDPAKLQRDIEFVNHNPLLSFFLSSINGILAVLNEQRQVLAVNHRFLKMLGVKDAGELLGLRIGNVVKCIHADEAPHGCGTTRYCVTCGAAVAIVSSLAQNKPVERICALQADRNQNTIDLSLLVRAQPLELESCRILLLFLQDITLQEKRAALERTFFHDINNILCILNSAAELLLADNPSSLADTIHQTTLRLQKEIAMQRYLIGRDGQPIQPIRHHVTSDQIFQDLQAFYAKHPKARNRTILFTKPTPPFTLTTDNSLLMRVLCNMITNALEAERKNKIIQVWATQDNKETRFFVQNDQPIPTENAHRIFQRNFSTKPGEGRGIGTYSMKLFGEEILGGRVQFASSPENGTIFSISIPVMLD